MPKPEDPTPQENSVSGASLTELTKGINAEGRALPDTELRAVLDFVGALKIKLQANAVTPRQVTLKQLAIYRQRFKTEQVLARRTCAPSRPETQISFDPSNDLPKSPSIESQSALLTMTMAKPRNLHRVTDEKWLRIEIGPAYDALKADAAGGISIDDVIVRLASMHELLFSAPLIDFNPSKSS